MELKVFKENRLMFKKIHLKTILPITIIIDRLEGYKKGLWSINERKDRILILDTTCKFFSIGPIVELAIVRTVNQSETIYCLKQKISFLRKISCGIFVLIFFIAGIYEPSSITQMIGLSILVIFLTYLPLILSFRKNTEFYQKLLDAELIKDL